MNDTTPAVGGLTEAEKGALWEAIESAFLDTTTYSRQGEDDIERAVERIIAARTEAADRKLARVTAAVEALAGMLREATEAEFGGPCRLDHNGDCQEHGYFGGPCLIPRAEAALAALSSAGTDALDRERVKVWDEGYSAARTMAHCYGHTDHWPAEDEPRNPYRAAAVSPEGGGA